MRIGREFAVFVDALEMLSVPPAVAASARSALLNAFGIGLGCLGTPYVQVAQQAVLSAEGVVPDGATLLADGRRTGIGAAALANAALFHGRAQEDTLGGAHIGTVIVPLLTALFERKALPMDRLLPSLLAGYEVAGRLEQLFAPATTPAGLRGTPLYGTIAAAAASAKALGLSPVQIEAALAIAAGMAGGTLQSFGDGTDEWRYQPGLAARTGWMATELALAGALTSPFAFEGRAGFIRAYARAEAVAEDVLAPLGHEWSILRNAYKRYPVCAYNQTVVATVLAMGRVRADELTEIRVHMNPFELGVPGMTFAGPFKSVGQTLMSVKFAAAATALYGIPTIRVMNTFDDPSLLALLERTRIVPDTEIPTFSCLVEMEARDGEVRAHRIDATGSDMNLGHTELIEVLSRVAGEAGVPLEIIDELAALIGQIETLPNMGLIVALFSRARAAVS